MSRRKPPVPDWALRSGVPRVHLGTFFRFLHDEGLVVADNDDIGCTCTAAPASPTVPHGVNGFLELRAVCNGCCRICADCGEPTIAFYKNSTQAKRTRCHACAGPTTLHDIVDYCAEPDE
jgi:hypothetical protein